MSVVQSLESQTGALRQQLEHLENTNQKLREQIEREAKSREGRRQQVERRNQIIEELQERIGKQQAIVEKLTKRLETVQLERDEIYKQCNRLLEHISDSGQSQRKTQAFQNNNSGEKPVGGVEEDLGWRLNMGCGKVKKAGYLNADVDIAVGPDLVLSLDSPLPFASNSFALIEAYHVIEHVYPWLGMDILRGLWRILKPEGKLAIECPNIEFASAWIVENSDYGFDSQMGMWAIYGDPNPKNPLHMHKWGYTPVTLAEMLKQAGFVSIRREVPEAHVPARDFRITAIKPTPSS